MCFACCCYSSIIKCGIDFEYLTRQDEEEDEESGSEASGGHGPRAETGPRPFAALSEDRAEPELVPGIPACFALRSASSTVPAVVARSLLWPGALTLLVGR